MACWKNALTCLICVIIEISFQHIIYIYIKSSLIHVPLRFLHIFLDYFSNLQVFYIQC